MVFLLLALAACDRAVKTPFHGIDITGADYGQEWSLTDHTGRQRNLADFKGKAVVMFFGFTHCPDVCPTTMAELAKVMRLLGPDAASVQVLFVTVDPERDTSAVLAKYVPAFHQSFLGMVGDDTTIRKTAREFRVYYEKQKVKGSDNDYTMDHTAGTLVFDREGRVRLFWSYGMEPEKMTADLTRLIK